MTQYENLPWIEDSLQQQLYPEIKLIVRKILQREVLASCCQCFCYDGFSPEVEWFWRVFEQKVVPCSKKPAGASDKGWHRRSRRNQYLDIGFFFSPMKHNRIKREPPPWAWVGGAPCPLWYATLFWSWSCLSCRLIWSPYSLYFWLVGSRSASSSLESRRSKKKATLNLRQNQALYQPTRDFGLFTKKVLTTGGDSHSSRD